MLNFDMTYKGGKVYMGIKETKCIFKEDTHQYFLVDVETGECVKELISVTTLLKKHGLSLDYSAVPSETLKAKAEYGTLVHKEIEQYIKHGEIGFTQELQDFMEYNKASDFDPIDSEFIVHNDIVAGTVDLLSGQTYIDDECLIMGDFKTTATLHKETVSWQLSLYAYLYKKQYGISINMLQAFHFSDGLKVVDIPFQPLEEIEKLLEAERNGEIYQGRQLAVAEDLLLQVAAAEQKIKDFELLKKEVESQAELLKQQLIEAMRTQGIKSFENDSLKITYIEPSTRETIDSARIKKELPEVAEQYKKISNIKDSVRITLKS